MVNSVTHTNGVESRYGIDPQKMQRPSSIAAAYGGTTYWSSGTYGYDGSGNIESIGSDYFYYDGVQRLVEGTSERVSSSVYKRQRQTYDVYGNITNIATTINGSTTNRSISVNPATNRLNNTSYEHVGNQLSWDGIYTYGYDSLGMMVSQQSSNRDILYLYTADDERVWEYDLLANRSDYTIRDLDNKVLRVFDENNGVWAWKKDMIHRAGVILGSASPAGAYHYTVDHLGTPRYISNASRSQFGKHAYYPFGQESTSDSQNQEFAKFTGHERDTNFTGTLDYLDYRYYNPMLGRFMGVDRQTGDVERPQSWNAYSYAWNSPLSLTDPNGERPIDPRYVPFLREILGNAALQGVDVQVGAVGDIVAHAGVFANAKAIGNTVFLEQDSVAQYETVTSRSVALLAHELVHVGQARLLGRARNQVLSYFTAEIFSRIGGGSGNASNYFEVPAYRMENSLRQFLDANPNILRKIRDGEAFTNEERVLIHSLRMPLHRRIAGVDRCANGEGQCTDK